MSPELAHLMGDRDFLLALRRLYNFRKLREMGAPLVFIEKASLFLEKSRKELGTSYHLITDVYDEYQAVEDAAIRADQDWEERCKGCVSWNGGANNGSDEMWCKRFSYDTRTLPEPCPEFQPVKLSGD